MLDGNTAALREHDRRESEPFDEDAAERFWLEHEEWSKSYIALHGQPGAWIVPPEDWEGECRA